MGYNSSALEAIVTIQFNTSMTRIKSIRERGSPWWSPLLCWMKSLGVPLRSTWVEEDTNRAHKMSRHLEPKPNLPNTSGRNDQDTESKALVMSNLCRILGCFWECKNLTVCWTNIKFSCCRCFTTDSLPRGYPGQYVRASAYAELDG